jgi:hypothetical protein
VVAGHEKSRNVSAEIETGRPVQVPNESADAVVQLAPVELNVPVGDVPERRVIVAATAE